MIKKVITDNNVETLEASYDGERFGLKYTNKGEFPSRKVDKVDRIILLNPKEALELKKFIEYGNNEYRNGL